MGNQSTAYCEKVAKESPLKKKVFIVTERFKILGKIESVKKKRGKKKKKGVISRILLTEVLLFLM